MGHLVSILIRSHNDAAFIGDTLRAVSAQKCDVPFEVVACDDGSTDGSGEVCDRYAARDGRVRVFHTANRGLSAARNHGLDHVRGGHVAFVDSDDWLEPSMYERLHGMAAQTGADVVTCRFYQEYRGRTAESAGPAEGPEVLRAYLLRPGVCQDSWNGLFSTSLFRSVRYPVGRSFEDYVIKPRLLQVAQRMAYTPACLYHYRNRRGSLSNAHDLKSNVDYWLAFRERFEYLGPLSEEYHRLTLAQAIGAIGRMWRWAASYSGEERWQAKAWMDEMQRFNDAHFGEVMRDSAYSRHTKLTALCARSDSPVLLGALYGVTRAYRGLRASDRDYFA